MFVFHCFDCHILAVQGDLALQSATLHEQLVGVANILGYEGGMPRVSPGDPQQSYLMHKIMGCEQSDPDWGYLQADMPPSLLPGSKPLSEEQKSLVYSWISQGAKDN